MGRRRAGVKPTRNLRILILAALAVLALVMARHCRWNRGGGLPERGSASAGSGAEGVPGGGPSETGGAPVPAPPDRSTEELEVRARALIDSDQPAEAIIVLLKILRVDPYHRSALDHLVTALVQTDSDPAAMHRMLATEAPGRAPDVLYAWSEERMNDDPESAGAILDLAIEAARAAGRRADAERWSLLRSR